jgi:hypothetical protein
MAAYFNLQYVAGSISGITFLSRLLVLGCQSSAITLPDESLCLYLYYVLLLVGSQ